MLKYCQNSLNGCCFSSLASDFDSINQIKAVNAISISIEELFKIQVGNHNYFANAILKNEKIVQGEQKFYYSMKIYKTRGSFEIFKYIREHMTLVQLMDSLGNVNHNISVVGFRIFESNYEKSLVLNREPLDMIFAPSFGEEQVATFETFFYTLRYTCLTAQPMKEQSIYIS